jgi:hypothetical protein
MYFSFCLGELDSDDKEDQRKEGHYSKNQVNVPVLKRSIGGLSDLWDSKLILYVGIP